MLNQAQEMICFAAIIECGSITHAAAELKRSKAHISRKLSDLESRYRVKLFYRSTRSMKLTDAGQRLQAQAVQIYNEHKRLNRAAHHVQSDLSGELSISVSDSSTSFLMAPLLPKLFAQFPDIRFDIRVSNQVVDLVNDKIDLAIRSGHVGDENLVARQIGMVTEKLYAAAGNQISAGDFGQVSELLRHKLLTNSYSLKEGRVQLFKGDEIAYLDVPDMALINRYRVILDLLQGTDFIAILPEYAAKDALRRGEIINILPDWHNGVWPVYLIHPFQMPMPHKLKLVAQFILEHVSV
ncbi:MAG: LysR family transcriptional regulator [Alphaproteobacteria bacterium]|nr:LysR family transcriptional regulator [Alphaproteobacteria bacterium]